jgi:hypothetical protein
MSSHFAMIVFLAVLGLPACENRVRTPQRRRARARRQLLRQRRGALRPAVHGLAGGWPARLPAGMRGSKRCGDPRRWLEGGVLKTGLRTVLAARRLTGVQTQTWLLRGCSFRDTLPPAVTRATEGPRRGGGGLRSLRAARSIQHRNPRSHPTQAEGPAVDHPLI